MKDNLIYIRHILDAIEIIEEYLADIGSYAEFANNRLLVDGVLRELTVIGEAANKISRAFRSGHPEIVLIDAIGMRNRIIHEYFAISTSIVWGTCQEDLPELKEKLLAILPLR